MKPTAGPDPQSPRERVRKVFDVDNLPPFVPPDVRAASANDVDKESAALRAALDPKAALDWRALANAQPRPVPFIVPGWLPQKAVTLLSGHGGSGKSYIGFGLDICIAQGRDWYGQPVQRRRVLMLSTEDDRDVLHWRAQRLCEWFGVNMADLHGWLFTFDCTSIDAALFRDSLAGGQFTEAYGILRDLVQRLRVEVLHLDAAGDLYDANKNDNRGVRRFVRTGLQRIVPATGAVLLTGHVDKAAARNPETSQGFGGAADWHNAVRSRLYLRPDGDGGDLLLECQKSNYAPDGASIRIRWNDEAKVFVGEPVVHAGPLARGLADAEAKGWILDALRKAEAAGDPVPAACSGPGRKMLDVLKARPDYPDSLKGSNGDRRARKLVEEMRVAGAVIVAAAPGSYRNKTPVLKVADTIEG